MPQKIDIQEIVKDNPQVDLAQLEEWRNLREMIRVQGRDRNRHLCTYPMQGRRAQIVDDNDSDARVIHLTGRK
ncbi:MAG TPA: hypothetical protein VFK06_11250 [Candidatus Angelobacter sp.]|nr:hypothetical protein [Candidatus Angelobacter sp.]